MASQVAEIERKVKRIERDLSKIRFTLKKIRPKSKKPDLTALQKSIGTHLVSDEDPVAVLQEMRRRKA